MNHDHDNKNICPYCPPVNSGQQLFSKSTESKLLPSLGVCGSVSCYVAMFPAILLGVIGIFGISSSATLSGLNVYANSVFFQPILILSILFLVAGILRYGAQPIALSVLGGIGVFVSMNIYMREWLFTLSFAFISLAYLLVFLKTKSPQFKFALALLLAVVILGVIDIGRTSFASPNPQNNNVPHQQMPPSMMQMQ